MNELLSGQAGCGLGAATLLGVMVILCIMMGYYIFQGLVHLGAVLKDRDDNLENGENKKSYRERTDALCKFSKYDCLVHEPVHLLLQLRRRLRLLISNHGEKSGHVKGLVGMNQIRVRQWNIAWWGKLAHVIKQLLSLSIHRRPTVMSPSKRMGYWQP